MCGRFRSQLIIMETIVSNKIGTSVDVHLKGLLILRCVIDKHTIIVRVHIDEFTKF